MPNRADQLPWFALPASKVFKYRLVPAGACARRLRNEQTPERDLRCRVVIANLYVSSDPSFLTAKILIECQVGCLLYLPQVGCLLYLPQA